MSPNQPPRQQLNFPSPVRLAKAARVIPTSTKKADGSTPASPSPEVENQRVANQAQSDRPAETDFAGQQQELKTQTRLLTQIKSQLDQIQSQQLAILSSFRESTISLAVQVASQLVGRAIEADSEHLFSKLESLLNRIDASHPVSIRLNPVDANRIRELINEHTFSSHQINLVPDPKQEIGNCLAESNDQLFVSDWKHQLLEIEKALHQATIFEQNAPHGQTGTEQTETSPGTQ